MQPGAQEQDAAQAPTSAPKTLLIMGGTGFLGPAVVEAAQAAGYEITLFNRGKTNPHLFPELEKLRGDRNEDLGPLKGRKFGAVIDTSAYYARQVKASAGLLAPNVEQYLFVSSISVYAEMGTPGLDEHGKTLPLPEPYDEDRKYYGEHKAHSERMAETMLPGRTTVVRPGLIVGPRDPTDRFTYWPVRARRGGRMLCPGKPSDPAQFIDVRDLANWMVGAIEARHMGIYNATGPAEPTTIGALIKACVAASGNTTEPVWADAEFLASQSVAPWMHMPVWVPPSDKEHGGISQVSIARALATGLKCRPITETVADTLAWWDTQPEKRREHLRAGLDPKREAEVLKALVQPTAQAARGFRGRAA